MKKLLSIVIISLLMSCNTRHDANTAITIQSLEDGYISTAYDTQKFTTIGDTLVIAVSLGTKYNSSKIYGKYIGVLPEPTVKQYVTITYLKATRIK